MPIESPEIRLRYGFVVIEREHQRDVDIDAGGSQGFDGRDAFTGRRYLDHDVRPRHDLPEMVGLGDCGFGVMGRGWRDFEADETVQPIAVAIDRPEHVGRRLNVLDDEALDKSAVSGIAVSV